jgi:hypothetical protein
MVAKFLIHKDGNLLDVKIDVLLYTKLEVSSLIEVLPEQLILHDLEATL